MDGMDAYLRVRRENENKTKRYAMVAADTTTELNNIVTVKSANHQLFIQRIILSPTTYAAQNILWRDDANTPVPIGITSVPAAAPTTGGYAGQHILDFGPEGWPLSAGKNLDGVVSAAGIAGAIVIEAFQKPVSGSINTGVAASGQ